MERTVIGSFKVTSGQVRVSDPCYEKDVWCKAVVDKVRNGDWKVSVTTHDFGRFGFGGVRVVELAAHLDGVHDHPGELVPADVGVDSGQLGFFEETMYGKAACVEGYQYAKPSEKIELDKEEDGMENDFYAACCDATLHRDYGVFAFGCVSSSGFGDGSYNLYVGRDKEGYVTSMRVVFINDEEEDETDETDDDYSGIAYEADA